MPPLSAIQRRVILALANIAAKKEAALVKARANFYRNNNNDDLEEKWLRARANFSNAHHALTMAERAAGQDPTTINYSVLERNRISNALSKVLMGTRLARVTYKRGLAEAKKLALANMKQFNKNFKLVRGRYTAIPTVNMTRRKKKSPSPPRKRARTPSPVRPANNAHRRVHGIGPVNNTRITWSRNANGKINRFKTLENINLHLTQAQRNALREMSENQAMNTIRQLARQR